ncbi:tyrosine-type recombinase/integrase [Phaeovulum vinaykumarii]|uniref:Site-specific recombinase XerD n=1 Tax=Phaeovulum vinaykumarii TaxID=407234 RepID=A0A1N7K6Q8_9RHOB|nr:tyrosine-type recombinase/integrase [Phaeovulum vinaykumarii]SIS57272.1 Site-specific recombinase XerD [Phaeovulum vinaykumarii]SOB93342.1 site-specific recombinase XerD [Phaeovulum vinaykumarii]
MAITTRKGSVNGTLYLYKRVPKRYAPVEPRKFVWVSLHTDSLSVARSKEAATWDQLVAAWEAKLAGDTTDAEQRFAAARELAEARGFRYMRADQVARLPLEELRDRFAQVGGFKDTPATPDMRDAAALLGAEQPPAITVSTALDLYWTLAKDRTLGKSEDQLRRWKNPRIKAVRNFIAVVGDKPIKDITGDDMLDFRNWWMERLEEEDLTSNSANKDLIHLGDVLKTVNRMKRLGLVLPLTDLSFKEGDARKRPPFSVRWIREKLLAPGALDGLNPEARAILLAMINTGCRPSELAALTVNTIKLNHNVPHISIEPEGRQVKTKHARRVVPLLGVSLEALRAFPEGFPRYRDSSASLSATINKFLRENDLMESNDHTLYSLRHSFEDRMLAAGIDDRIRRDILGHRLSRERYGDGATLEHMHELLQATAL